MAKPKIIEKKLLLRAFITYKKYSHSLNECESDINYDEWMKACKKAFPHDKRNYREYDLLKEILRTLRHKDNETVVKVYQALGYVVVDNVADYLRKKQDDLEQEIYNEMCNGCSKENLCHEECEHCEKYYKALEKKGIRKY